MPVRGVVVHRKSYKVYFCVTNAWPDVLKRAFNLEGRSDKIILITCHPRSEEDGGNVRDDVLFTMFCSIGQEEWLKNLSIEFSFPELRTEEHLSTLRELTVRQVLDQAVEDGALAHYNTNFLARVESATGEQHPTSSLPTVPSVPPTTQTKPSHRRNRPPTPYPVNLRRFYPDYKSEDEDDFFGTEALAQAEEDYEPIFQIPEMAREDWDYLVDRCKSRGIELPSFCRPDRELAPDRWGVYEHLQGPNWATPPDHLEARRLWRAELQYSFTVWERDMEALKKHAMTKFGTDPENFKSKGSGQYALPDFKWLHERGYIDRQGNKVRFIPWFKQWKRERDATEQEGLPHFPDATPPLPTPAPRAPHPDFFPEDSDGVDKFFMPYGMVACASYIAYVAHVKDVEYHEKVHYWKHLGHLRDENGDISMKLVRKAYKELGVELMKLLQTNQARDGGGGDCQEDLEAAELKDWLVMNARELSRMILQSKDCEESLPFLASFTDDVDDDDDSGGEEEGGEHDIDERRDVDDEDRSANDEWLTSAHLRPQPDYVGLGPVMLAIMQAQASNKQGEASTYGMSMVTGGVRRLCVGDHPEMGKKEQKEKKERISVVVDDRMARYRMVQEMLKKRGWKKKNEAGKEEEDEEEYDEGEPPFSPFSKAEEWNFRVHLAVKNSMHAWLTYVLGSKYGTILTQHPDGDVFGPHRPAPDLFDPLIKYHVYNPRTRVMRTKREQFIRTMHQASVWSGGLDGDLTLKDIWTYWGPMLEDKEVGMLVPTKGARHWMFLEGEEGEAAGVEEREAKIERGGRGCVYYYYGGVGGTGGEMSSVWVTKSYFAM